MEYPSKRIKMWWSSQVSDLRPNEHSRASKPSTRSRDTARLTPSTPTTAPPFQEPVRKGLFGRSTRPQVQRKNAASIVPRAPMMTMVANVIEVVVDDGASSVTATQISNPTASTVVSLSSFGAVTFPGVTATATRPPRMSVLAAEIDDSASSQAVLTSPVSPVAADTSFTSTTSAALAPAASALLSPFNTTSTLTTQVGTTTITSTSTFLLSFSNGHLASAAPVISGTNATTSSTLTTSTSSTSLSSSSSSSSSSLVTSTSTSGSLSSSNAASSSTSTPGSVESSATTATGIVGSASSAPSPSSTSTPSSSGSSGSSTPQIVGGVVGGLAGLALLLLLLLFFLRWYRRRLKARGQLPEQIAARSEAAGGDEPGTPAPMSQRSSNVPFVAAMASPFKRWRPGSSQTMTTEATTAASASTETERGFQRIAGRKIAPVLQTGGDPYGGNYGAFEKETASGAAGPSTPSGPAAAQGAEDKGMVGGPFYRDSGGRFGGSGEVSSRPTTPVRSRGTNNTKDFAGGTTHDSPMEGITLRPSPARTPITNSPHTSIQGLPIQRPEPSGIVMGDDVPPTPPLPPHLQRDSIRSFASHESGSRGGRFTEEV